MVTDAEANRGEDQRLREQVDARNQLDSAAYQVERLLRERGDALPTHERARAEMLVNDAREAMKSDAPLDRMRELTQDLQQMAQSLAASAQADAGTGGATADAGARTGAAGSSDDDVIDAEFTGG
jgi:molecular chaperone DnaK